MKENEYQLLIDKLWIDQLCCGISAFKITDKGICRIPPDQLGCPADSQLYEDIIETKIEKKEKP